MSARSVVRSVLSIALIAAIFLYFLPNVVDYREVWEAIAAMTPLELLTLGLLALWNQVTYVLVERAARPGLTTRQAVQITQTSTAVANTLPGGAAFGAALQSAMYRSYGFAPPDIAISMAMTGVWNTLVKLAMPVAALALLVIAGEANAGLVVASIIGIGVLVVAVLLFAVALRSERGAATVGRLLSPLFSFVARILHRPPHEDWGAAVNRFRRRTVDLLGKRWMVLTAATLVSHLTLYLVLLLTLRHIGIPNSIVSWEEVLASFAFVRLLSALPITPGGLGVVELGLTATLVTAGGDEAQVVAAVLIYRFLTFVLPIPFGALSYLLWRHQERRPKVA